MCIKISSFNTVQLDLNLMFVCAVPMSKSTRSACAQPGTRVSTSNMQVTRVHTGEKGDMQVHLSLSTSAL